FNRLVDYTISDRSGTGATCDPLTSAGRAWLEVFVAVKRPGEARYILVNYLMRNPRLFHAETKQIKHLPRVV
ncbi:hypothetical protein, partial [Mesorhizobium sp.]|uniref:hypothetical protein n=1 Tax=Mesorhizobium sp. TaxID=1871066 RepID=UPI0025C52020